MTRRVAAVVVPGLQWLALIVPVVLSHVLVLGAVLGLGSAEVARIAGGAVFLVGLGSAAQVLVGHRMPLFEGPASVYLVAAIVATGSLAAAGVSGASALPPLAGGLLASCLFLLGLAWSGLAGRLTRLVSEFVVWTFMVYLGVELVRTLVPIAIQRDPAHPAGRPLAWLIAGGMVAVFVIARWLRPLQSGAMLAALLAGVAAYAVAGGIESVAPTAMSSGPTALLPVAPPTLVLPVVVPFLFAAGFAAVNVAASLQSMASATRRVATHRDVVRGTVCSGVTTAVMGMVAGTGTTPHISSVGLLRGMSSSALDEQERGVRGRHSLLLAAVALAAAPLLPGVLSRLAMVPREAAAVVLLFAVALVSAQGFSGYRALWRTAGGRLRVLVVAAVTGIAAAWSAQAPGAAQSAWGVVAASPFLTATATALGVEAAGRLVSFVEDR